MDRYSDIQAAEDLGLVEDDNTEDLVGAQKEDPAPAATGDEVDVHQPTKGMRTQ
ncbi:hypothetical protein [Microbispora sp. NRRL B-24597]|uniref:hypothetical protein n=1 Tax=Microbispora sp. NRRL B-24597 TaxID=1463823 RepID=UPI000AE8684C|nr:hypothetical protein [Microbispora sp. NRRL B-24597]